MLSSFLKGYLIEGKRGILLFVGVVGHRFCFVSVWVGNPTFWFNFVWKKVLSLAFQQNFSSHHCLKDGSMKTEPFWTDEIHRKRQRREFQFEREWESVCVLERERGERLENRDPKRREKLSILMQKNDTICFKRWIFSSPLPLLIPNIFGDPPFEMLSTQNYHFISMLLLLVDHILGWAKRLA